jgi:hypothetical protein
MDASASQGIFGTGQNDEASMQWTQTSEATAMTGIVVSTSAVASTALAATPAVPAATCPYYFNAQLVSGANDIVRHLAPFLGVDGLVTISSLSEVAAMKLKEAIINEWAKLGVTVKLEDIPPVPNASLLKPGEFLMLIPKGRTLNALASRIRYYDQEVKDAYGEQAVENSYWVAVPDKVLEETRGLPFAKQVEIMNDKCPGAQVAKLPEICAATLIHQERTGERLLSDNPPTYTYIRTLEQFKGYQTVMVSFTLDGLFVYYRSWGTHFIVLLPIRKL